MLGEFGGNGLGGELPRQVNGQTVCFDVRDTRRADCQMLLDQLTVILGQFVRDEVDEQLNELTASHHAGTSSK
jgi:hypothetical protein